MRTYHALHTFTDCGPLRGFVNSQTAVNFQTRSRRQFDHQSGHALMRYDFGGILERLAFFCGHVVNLIPVVQPCRRRNCDAGGRKCNRAGESNSPSSGPQVH